MTMVRMLAAAACALLLTTRASPAAEPFETVTLEVAGVLNTNHNRFHRYWDPAAGIEIGAETPFYAGILQGGIHHFTSSGREPEFPDFQANYTYLGWGVEPGWGRGLRWLNGARVGVMWMDFNDDLLAAAGREENELGLSAVSRLRIRVKSGFSVSASVRYRRVFTNPRMEFTFVGAGLTLTFTTPEWLREVLR